MATAFSLPVMVIWMVVGSTAFERLGASWFAIVGVYYVALPLGGCAYGALLPLKRFALGAMLLGFVLVLPMYAAFAVILGLSLNRLPSIQVALIIGVILSAFVGGAVGLSEWNDERVDRRDNTKGGQRTEGGGVD